VIFSSLRFSLAGPNIGDAQRADMYTATLDMCEYADKAGFAFVTVSEHHGTDTGWMPSPMVLAGMIAARTQKLRISIGALLLPLHDPLRCAEDLVTLDIVSRGRVNTIAGLGYRPSEYAAHLKSWDDRGAIMDEVIDVLLKAWTAQSFDYKGQTVQVTPAPYTKPHPTLIIGGESKPAARRAARHNLPFSPAAYLPELDVYYREQCELHGHTPMNMQPPEDFAMFWMAEDPDKAWEEIGPHLLADAQMYQSWQNKTEGTVRSAVYSESRSVEQLRAEGIYRIVTPEECVHLIKGGMWSVNMHPLCGGIPVDKAWESLQLYVDRVLPEVR
jgi:alkanesulfonate monooxygenase SsuD/methylene tetrahydromethanopterin reductase-like flavin-dependent oxidoreductase (luciferase family)